MTSIKDAISRIEGTVGLSARHLETGREIQHNAGDVFFTASTLKVPVLVELYRQVDRGRIDLNRRVELTDDHRVPGSGILKEMAPGLNPTVHDLAMLMIIISDNTATDILYNLVGGNKLNNTMRELGLSRTRIPMTVRELLFSVVGLDPGNPDHTYERAPAGSSTRNTCPTARVTTSTGPTFPHPAICAGCWNCCIRAICCRPRPGTARWTS